MPLHELFPVGHESRLLTIARELVRTKTQVHAKKDPRKINKSRIITALNGHYLSTSSHYTHKDSVQVAHRLPGYVSIYVGHLHAPTMVRDQLHEPLTQMKSSLANHQSGEWSHRRFTLPEAQPLPMYPPTEYYCMH